jgi:hypothetical protein
MVTRVILERDLEAYFTKQCKKYGIMSLKLNVRFSRGWPDRIVPLENGEVLWVELKRPGGVVSPMQEKVHEQLQITLPGTQRGSCQGGLRARLPGPVL